MKTLENHTILYDSGCPMCRLYTGFFVRTGMLDRGGREPFYALPPDIRACIDERRASNEIALVNRATGEVRYGVDSLTAIIGHAAPRLKPLMHARLVQWFVRRLYRLVSYNRRVIMPVKSVARFYCVPDFSAKWRLTFILLCAVLSSLLLVAMWDRMFFGILLPYFLATNLAQQGWQALWLRQDYRRRMEYAGNIGTLQLAGSLLCWIVGSLLLLLGGSFGSLWLLLLMVEILMALEHYRRARLLRLPVYTTLAWVTWRIAPFVVLFNHHIEKPLTECWQYQQKIAPPEWYCANFPAPADGQHHAISGWPHARQKIGQ